MRGYLVSGHPVVALVHSRLLPGHAPDEPDTDQAIMLLGMNNNGDQFIYSDPAFASSLGYGLQISGPDLEAAWEHAATPRRGVAFARRFAAIAGQPSAAEPDSDAQPEAESSPTEVPARVEPTICAARTPRTAAVTP